MDGKLSRKNRAGGDDKHIQRVRLKKRGGEIRRAVNQLSVYSGNAKKELQECHCSKPCCVQSADAIVSVLFFFYLLSPPSPPISDRLSRALFGLVWN